MADSGVSAAAESQLSPFLVRRPWPKHSIFHFCSFRPRPNLCFCCFLLIGHGRKLIFVVFSLSAVAAERFSASFPFSSVDDERFFAFSHFHPWMTNSFSR
ncbi:MAG: hypothetical protein ACFN05_10750, partial [Segatella oris]